jgi:hypothetical protein
MPAKFVKTPKYVAPDGTEFDTLEQEIIHELKSAGLDEKVATAVCGDRKKLVEILNQRERKNASAAVRKPRKPRAAKPEPPPAP